jgi:hypothetical protein
VYGESASTSGRGVWGFNVVASGLGYGVYGIAHSTEGTGARGIATHATGHAYGVFGFSLSTSGRAVEGYAGSTSGTTYGVYGTSESENGRGIYGFASYGSGDATGVQGEVNSPDGWAGRFTSSAGNGVFISVPAGKAGLNVASGSKNAVVPTADGARLLYAEEATEVWFSDYGFAQLQDGTALVPIDAVYAQTVNLNEPYHVFLQPYGDAEIHVAERGPGSFEVRLGGGDPEVTFSYRIVAKRLGFEGQRLARAPWADDDPNLYPVQPGSETNQPRPELVPAEAPRGDADGRTGHPEDSRTSAGPAEGWVVTETSTGGGAAGERAATRVSDALVAATHDHWGEVWIGSGTGLTLISSDHDAVHGIATATSGGAFGVYGNNKSTDGDGVHGVATATSGSSNGVYGESDADDGRGIFGLNIHSSGSTVGVSGHTYSSSGIGVFGHATAATGSTFGIFGRSASSSGIGIYGLATASSGATTGVHGEVSSPTGWAAKFTSSTGNGVYISVPAGKAGLNVASGTKNAVVPTADGARLLYAEEGTEVWFSDYGFGQLQEGAATIAIEPTFAQTVNLNEPYYVFLQVYGDASLYVSSRAVDHFEVLLRQGDPEVTFSYRLVAKRLAHEAQRLARAPWADADPNLYPQEGLDWADIEGGSRLSPEEVDPSIWQSEEENQ